MNEKLAKMNQSVEKTLQIIELMAANAQPMRLNDISQELEIPNSTVLRMLNTLQKYGYVNQNANDLRYSLSMKFARIGSKIASDMSITNMARPDLVALSEKCGESACLAICDEKEKKVLYIDTVDGPDNMLKTFSRIGKTAPMYCTGVGKLMLLNYSRQMVRNIYAGREFTRFTRHTITSVEELLAELDRVKDRGYALDDEECEIGAKCVAAAIRDYSGKVVAAISVSGPTLRFNAQKMGDIVRNVKTSARNISEKLGYQG